MAEPGRAQLSRGAATVRLVLTRRALEDPVHGQCGVCLEPRYASRPQRWFLTVALAVSAQQTQPRTGRPNWMHTGVGV